jgi:acyl dehydratase
MVDQDRIDRFAEATGDHQWIHVDRERAASTLFGSTVAHGYLTLALAPALLEEILEVDGAGMVINYGVNRLRFPAPVRAGSRVRLLAEITAAEAAKDGATQVTFLLTFEADASKRPVCVAEILFRYYPQGTEAGEGGASKAVER